MGSGTGGGLLAIWKGSLRDSSKQGLRSGLIIECVAAMLNMVFPLTVAQEQAHSLNGILSGLNDNQKGTAGFEPKPSGDT